MEEEGAAMGQQRVSLHLPEPDTSRPLTPLHWLVGHYVYWTRRPHLIHTYIHREVANYSKVGQSVHNVQTEPVVILRKRVAMGGIRTYYTLSSSECSIYQAFLTYSS